MHSEPASQWEIDQDEFGNPVVSHRHTTVTVAAYVSKDADGRRSASCPECGERLDVPEKR